MQKQIGIFGKAQATVQKGFTLVELLLVIAVIGILGALATPFIRELLIEARVEPTAKDVTVVVNAMRAAAATASSGTPYVNLGAPAAATANFANTARGRATAMTVAGAGATATSQHTLGATGAQIAVAQGNIAALGDSFTVTFPTVNKAACPGLANQLAKQAEVILINTVAVKPAGGAYNGAAGENACTAGDTNTYVMTFR